ncbi:MAG: acyl-CoA dehydrogenase family protein [Thermomicrobiales bacterium]
MDFDFSEDQNMLRDLAREFLTEQVSIAHIREMMEDETGYDKNLYRRFLQLGLIPLPEEYGGAGFGMVETSIIMEEMGRIPYPGPFFGTIVLAGQAIVQSGDEAGDVSLPSGHSERRSGREPGIPRRLGKLDAGDDPGDSHERRRRLHPEREETVRSLGAQADVLLVAARTGGDDEAEGVSLFAVPADAAGVEISPETMLDLNSRTATVKLNDVSVGADALIGEEGEAWAGLDRAIQRAAVAASAEMLGAARRSHEMSVDYAKVRRQFGQVIGQFQAIKHKLAEMLEQVENAHSAVYYASWALDADAPDATLAASVAKSTANEASRHVCGEAIQVHGGIGFTWEYDLHLYWKRPSTRRSSTATATTTANAYCRKCWRGMLPGRD